MKNVEYVKDGAVQTFEIGVPGLEKIVVDQTNVPENERGGLAKQLLAASTLACYGATLSSALAARGVTDAKIKGSASFGFGKNDLGQGRITAMTLTFHVELKEADREVFERCAKIMRAGCLVTGSVHEGIQMKYELEADYK